VLTDLAVDDDGFEFRYTGPPGGTLELLLGARRIWSLRVPAPASPDGDALRRVEWPDGVRPHLRGRATFTLRPVGDAAAATAVTTRLGGVDTPLQFVDRHGRGLVVNKWGTVGHALADHAQGTVQRLLDNMDRVRDAVRRTTDLDVYVTSGTLLGPYRDGHLIPSDDDADLGYLSRHQHPAEVVRETLLLGRHLAAAGLEVVRMSGGHLQVHFTHDGAPDVYVDVFTGWIDEDGWWYQAFAVRHRTRRDQLLPVSTIEVEGRREPAPREPETMLEGIYGPGWKVPDPAFTFAVPPAAANRFWGWCGDLAMDRETWESLHDEAATALSAEPSPYARWLAARLPAGGRVVELGAGTGSDARWLAAQGHPVEAVDYARSAVALAAVALPAGGATDGAPVDVRVLNLYDLRQVVTFGAEVAARREPVTVYGRDLLATLWDDGRATLFRLLSMLLRAGGEAHLDVPHDDVVPVPGPVPLYRAVPSGRLTAEMAGFGLRVVEEHQVVEDVPTGAGPVPVTKTRMVVSWQRRVA